ncbi:MAG TPA: ECF-type sigma factor [Planctomycetota bacterium]|nr:ECF-type sigma factor [Planctomycetota bacterium]
MDTRTQRRPPASPGHAKAKFRVLPAHRDLPPRAGIEHNGRGPGFALGAAPSMPDLTRFLQLASTGASPPDEIAIGALYDEIRRLARSLMRHERPDHTLAPTALANEAYLRLFGASQPGFANGAEFFGAAVTALRRILVEHGRRRSRQKRGGSRGRADVETDLLPAPAADDRLLALDEALQRLAVFDPGKARLVELRFFGGLTVDEAASLLGQSPRTVAREWRVARAFLRAELQEGGEADDLDA